MAGNKVFFTVGGMGTTPDKNIRQVAPGNFTKQSRGVKPIKGNQTRINSDMTDNSIQTIYK